MKLSATLPKFTILAAAFASAQLASGSTVIVAENFGGTGANLNGTTADTFALGITTSLGSNTWVGATSFKDNGIVNNGNNQNIYLNMGNYINATKGTANGLFTLSVTISPVNGTWVGFGFFVDNTPGTSTNFTSVDSPGAGFFIYRSTGTLDGFGGPRSTNVVNGPTSQSGNQLMTIMLDLTPAGGYNGTDNFGTVSFIQGDANTASFGSYTHTNPISFGSIGFSAAGQSSGTLSGFQLTQIPEPSTALLGGLGACCACSAAAAEIPARSKLLLFHPSRHSLGCGGFFSLNS